jgi:hypothetical protein
MDGCTGLPVPGTARVTTIGTSSGPKTLVRGKFSTDGVWRTADNVRLFHRCSPTRYPFGEHLLAEEQKDELRQAELDKLAAIRDAYMHGDLIEEIYNVRKMLDLTSEPGVIGAARLIRLSIVSSRADCYGCVCRR